MIWTFFSWLYANWFSQEPVDIFLFLFFFLVKLLLFLRGRFHVKNICFMWPGFRSSLEKNVLKNKMPSVKIVEINILMKCAQYLLTKLISFVDCVSPSYLCYPFCVWVSIGAFLFLLLAWVLFLHLLILYYGTNMSFCTTCRDWS